MNILGRNTEKARLMLEMYYLKLKEAMAASGQENHDREIIESNDLIEVRL
jgi:hypothetical protein